MAALIQEKEVKLDSRHRVTVSKPLSRYYKMKQYADGKIVMEPQELISKEVLEQMDESMRNIKAGKIGIPVNMEEVEFLSNLEEK